MRTPKWYKCHTTLSIRSAARYQASSLQFIFIFIRSEHLILVTVSILMPLSSLPATQIDDMFLLSIRCCDLCLPIFLTPFDAERRRQIMRFLMNASIKQILVHLANGVQLLLRWWKTISFNYKFSSKWSSTEVVSGNEWNPQFGEYLWAEMEGEIYLHEIVIMQLYAK